MNDKMLSMFLSNNVNIYAFLENEIDDLMYLFNETFYCDKVNENYLLYIVNRSCIFSIGKKPIGKLVDSNLCYNFNERAKEISRRYRYNKKSEYMEINKLLNEFINILNGKE